MKVLEFGVILNGLSVVYKQYSLKKSKNTLKGDPELRNALLGAILSMSKSVLVQHISSFNFKRYKLIITSPTLPKDVQYDPELIFYSIAEKRINVEYLTEKMEQIQDRFLSQFPDIFQHSRIETAKYTPFLPVIDEILEDLKDTHSERFGHIF
ncbi:MAG: hypothetical protein ACTSRD_13795 [Promethearchaeota archaeon]